jgi:tRNA (cytidine32/uridine32-2'-O)-methyltransferase
MVDHSGFLADREPGQVRLRLRRLFFRTRLDQVEVNMLRGIFTGLERVLGAKASASEAPAPDRTS